MTREAQIVAAYRAGEKTDVIRSEIGCGWPSLMAALKKAGVKLRGRGRRANGERNARIAARYEAGLSAREIAQEFGLSLNAVYSALERAGVKRRSGGHRRRAMLPADLGLPA